MGPGDRFEYLTDLASKLTARSLASPRFCIACAMPVRPKHHPIDADDVQSAIIVGEALEVHALAAFDMIGADPDIEAARVALAIVRHLANGYGGLLARATR